MNSDTHHQAASLVRPDLVASAVVESYSEGRPPARQIFPAGSGAATVGQRAPLWWSVSAVVPAGRLGTAMGLTAPASARMCLWRARSCAPGSRPSSLDRKSVGEGKRVD